MEGTKTNAKKKKKKGNQKLKSKKEESKSKKKSHQADRRQGLCFGCTSPGTISLAETLGFLAATGLGKQAEALTAGAFGGCVGAAAKDGRAHGPHHRDRCVSNGKRGKVGELCAATQAEDRGGG